MRGLLRNSHTERTRVDRFAWAPSKPSVEDIDRGVMVAVEHNATMDTDMCSHAEVFVLTLLPTCAAYLAGFLWVHLHDGDTSVLCFVLNQFNEACPSSVYYACIQTCFRGGTIRQVFSILRHDGLWSLDHVMHREIFKDDDLEGINQKTRVFLLKIPSLIANLLMSLGNPISRSFSSIAPLLFLGQPLLLLLQPPMRLS